MKLWNFGRQSAVPIIPLAMVALAAFSMFTSDVAKAQAPGAVCSVEELPLGSGICDCADGINTVSLGMLCPAAAVMCPDGSSVTPPDICPVVESEEEEECPSGTSGVYPNCVSRAATYEGARTTSRAGQLLQGIGSSLVNQQFNFGGVGTFAGPTGQLRHTKHDGLRDRASGANTGSFEISEGSVFGNASTDLPGTVFGGKVRLSGLVGYTRLEQNSILNGAFGTDIDSVIYGGSYLWSSGSFYTMSIIIGLSGEADAYNALGRYSYDVSGYFTNSVIGNTFSLPGALKFDLRGALGYYDVDTDGFVIAGTAGRTEAFSDAWKASLTGTLFTLIEVDSGGVIRPYVLASYKHVFDENIGLSGAVAASLEQAEDFGKLEFGFDYVVGMFTYGGAGYTEFSEDETTFGARLGVSVKLQ